MGVDAGIFAKKAKRYFWFDRLSNIEAYWNHTDHNAFHTLNSTKSKLMMQDNNLSEKEIIDFLNANVEAWEQGKESKRYHANWVRQIVEFVKTHSGDSFFVAADNGNAYELIGEMNGKSGGIWNGEYLEWP